MTILPKLNSSNLASIGGSVKKPNYDRTELTPGIVHIGVGNFHRAHQAWYLHRLMQKGQALDWAIVGAGVRAGDTAQRNKLQSQDWLTTLIKLDPNGRSAEIIGPMIDYTPVEENNNSLIEQLAKPEIRIASLTITEGGYYVDPATCEFHANHPDILHDAENPDTPRTVFGALVAALELRRSNGAGPLTGLCCDNLMNNGKKFQQAVVTLAEMSDKNLAQWIDSNCSFPNTVVDCIVPATGPNELAYAKEFGIDDSVPVTHENFRQWIIEDNFCAGRPNLEDSGAVFSDNVHGYENMKIRILNGGHQLLANPGELMSVATIADCMQLPVLRNYFRKVAETEIAPMVNSVGGLSPIEYLDMIDVRFQNTAIRDTVRRVAFDGTSRHTGFLIPAIRESLESGSSIVGLSLAEALWARMCEGTREDGTTIEPNDANWDELMETARLAKNKPEHWLEQRQFYGDLADNSRFATSFGFWLNMLYEKGTEATLVSYVQKK